MSYMIRVLTNGYLIVMSVKQKKTEVKQVYEWKLMNGLKVQKEFNIGI